MCIYSERDTYVNIYKQNPTCIYIYMYYFVGLCLCPEEPKHSKKKECQK